MPVFKNEGLRNYRPISLASGPRKVTEQVFLEAISKHKKHRRMTGNGSMDIPRAFYKMTICAGKVKSVDVIYLDFSKHSHQGG